MGCLDWEEVSSGESVEKMGVLLFLIGAGIGAVLVLLTLWALSHCKTRKNKTEQAEGKVPGEDAEKGEMVEQDTAGKIYNIQVHHMREITDHHGAHNPSLNHSGDALGIKLTDSSLLNKLGLGVKSTPDDWSRE